MSWSVSEAKAKLSEVLQRAARAPQVIESRGEAVAVVLSKAEYDRLQQQTAKPVPGPLSQWLDLTERLKAETDLTLEAPKRRRDRPRRSPFEG